MARQYFRSQIYEPNPVTQTQVAAAAETNLWNPAATGKAPNTAIPANSISPNQIFKVTAWGTSTTAVTGSQTIILSLRYGNSNTPSSNTLIGVKSPTQAVNAVARTDPWIVEAWMCFRTIGTAGTATGFAELRDPKVVGTAAGTNSIILNCGSSTTTPTTVDTTVAAGIVVAVQPSLNTYTFDCVSVTMESIS